MAGNLESVIGQIPFLGGWEAARQQNEARQRAELGQATSLMALLQHAQTYKDAQTLKQVMAAPGTQEEKMQLLLASGPRGPEMAQHYGAALKVMEEAKIRQQLTAGSLDLKNPDVLDKLSSIPGMGHYATMAERQRQQSAAEESFKLMRGTQLPEAQGVQPSQAGTVGFAPSEEDALRQIQEAKQKGGTATIQVEPGAQLGAFGSLINSQNPQVAAQARMLNNLMKQTPPTPQSLKYFENQQKSLEAQEARFVEERRSALDRQAFAKSMQETALGARNPPAPHTTVDEKGNLLQWNSATGSWAPAIGANGAPIMAQAGQAAVAADERRRATQFQQQIGPQREQLAHFETYQQAKETWKPGEKVPPAYIAAAQQFLQMSRTSRVFKGEVEQALGGGNIAQRVWGSLSRIVTGEPSDEQLADLDRIMKAMSIASANNIGTAIRNTRADAIAAGRRPEAVVGGPKVYGSILILPTGRIIALDTNASALKAAQKWTEENSAQ